MVKWIICSLLVNVNHHLLISQNSKGWVVRIYHNLKSDNVESWTILNNILDLGSNSSRDHIDLCNATEIIRNRQLGDLFEMTWRWVYQLQYLSNSRLSILLLLLIILIRSIWWCCCSCLCWMTWWTHFCPEIQIVRCFHVKRTLFGNGWPPIKPSTSWEIIQLTVAFLLDVGSLKWHEMLFKIVPGKILFLTFFVGKRLLGSENPPKSPSHRQRGGENVSRESFASIRLRSTIAD